MILDGNDSVKQFRTRMLYSSNILPTEMDSLLAKNSRVACKALVHESYVEFKVTPL